MSDDAIKVEQNNTICSDCGLPPEQHKIRCAMHIMFLEGRIIELEVQMRALQQALREHRINEIHVK